MFFFCNILMFLKIESGKLLFMFHINLLLSKNIFFFFVLKTTETLNFCYTEGKKKKKKS